MNDKALIQRDPGALTTLSPAGAILAWADATTDASSRRRGDLLRDKTRAVRDFFEFVGKSPDLVTDSDVKRWQIELEERGLAHSTVYGMISRISSFYRWALKDPDIATWIKRNPVIMARPKAPKPYQSESASSIQEEDLKKLIDVVKAKAESGDLVGIRDYAIIMHLIITGRRRAEVINLKWGDVTLGQNLIIRYLVKGGEYETRQVASPMVGLSMLNYLRASHRLEGMEEDSPIWISHRKSRVGVEGDPLTSHAFAKNLKSYARKAGIKNIHVHQLRHSFAAIAGDETGSMSEVQEALGHKDIRTTKVYLQRVGVIKDKTSIKVAERLGL